MTETEYKIMPFSKEYRDDMIFCFLLAKEALRAVPPKLREDLLDIEKNYFEKGDMFWIAVDLSNRVVGMIGTNIVSDTDMWLRRLFIKPVVKRKGIGSALLAVAEEFAKSKSIKKIHTRFADDYQDAAQFYPSKGFVETDRLDGLRHFIKIIGG